MLDAVIWAVIIYFGLRIAADMFLSSVAADEAREEILEKADRIIRMVKLEPLPDQNTILAYDGENNQFLGQGTTEAEVKESIMKRFPEKVFILNDKPFCANESIRIKIEKIEKLTTSNTR